MGGKGGRCVRLTLLLSCDDCLEIWEPHTPDTLINLSGSIRRLLYILLFITVSRESFPKNIWGCHSGAA
jgi:hypothetical protein